MQSWSRAMTLIEVVAALALLGGTATAVLMAHERLSDQSRRSSQVLEACDATDRWLAQLRLNGQTLEPDQSGVLPTHEQMTWRTELVAINALEPFEIQHLHLKVFNSSNPQRPLLTMDLFQPIAKQETN